MKSQISMNKGTKSIQLEVGIPNWSGEHFKTYQKEKMASMSTNSIMSTKRGTVGIRSSAYPKPRHTIVPAGYRVSSARGTTTRTL